MGDVAFKLQTQADEMRMKETKDKEASTDRQMKALASNPTMARLYGQRLGLSPEQIEAYIAENIEYKKETARQSQPAIVKLALELATRDGADPNDPQVFKNYLSQAAELQRGASGDYGQGRVIDDKMVFPGKTPDAGYVIQDMPELEAVKDAKETAKLERFNLAQQRGLTKVFDGYADKFIKYTEGVEDAIQSARTGLRSAEKYLSNPADPENRVRAFGALFSFIKNLDNSVVRASEISAFNELKTYRTRLQDFINKEAKGIEVFNPADARGMAAIAREAIADLTKRIKEKQGYYKKRSLNHPTLALLRREVDPGLIDAWVNESLFDFNPGAEPDVTGATSQGIDPRLSIDSLGPLPNGNATGTLGIDPNDMPKGWGQP
jgi:hypothetical protein